MDFPLQLDKAPDRLLWTIRLTSSAFLTSLSHLPPRASVPFTTLHFTALQWTQAFSLPFHVLRKLFLSALASVHLLFLCIFCLECFPALTGLIPLDWLLLAFLSPLECHLQGGAASLSPEGSPRCPAHYPAFLLHSIHHSMNPLRCPLFLSTVDVSFIQAGALPCSSLCFIKTWHISRAQRITLSKWTSGSKCKFNSSSFNCEENRKTFISIQKLKKSSSYEYFFIRSKQI